MSMKSIFAFCLVALLPAIDANAQETPAPPKVSAIMATADAPH
jgi:hypothetical protein